MEGKQEAPGPEVGGNLGGPPPPYWPTIPPLPTPGKGAVPPGEMTSWAIWAVACSSSLAKAPVLSTKAAEPLKATYL